MVDLPPSFSEDISSDCGAGFDGATVAFVTCFLFAFDSVMLEFGAGKPWDEAAEYDMTRVGWLAAAELVAIDVDRVWAIVVDG